MIKLNNISKTYTANGAKVTALQQLNLQIHQGEIFCIIGKSGSGKTSLLRLMNRLEEPTSGQLIVAGVNLSQLRGSALRLARQNIGCIFQHFNLLNSRTVSENIAFALEVAGVGRVSIQKRVQALVELVGLTDRAHHYPNELSGGQKQRVAIARALATAPKIVLADEITSALDSIATQSILRLLRRINQELGITIVLITHELAVAETISDRIGVLDQGVLVEVAATAHLFTSPKHPISQNLINASVHREVSHV